MNNDSDGLTLHKSVGSFADQNGLFEQHTVEEYKNTHMKPDCICILGVNDLYNMSMIEARQFKYHEKKVIFLDGSKYISAVTE